MTTRTSTALRTLADLLDWCHPNAHADFMRGLHQRARANAAEGGAQGARELAAYERGRADERAGVVALGWAWVDENADSQEDDLVRFLEHIESGGKK